jgi:hypothetical protein
VSSTTLGSHTMTIPTDRRRWLQLALATIWVLDGVLQYQSYMFSSSFGSDMLAGTVDGSPHWLATSVLWAAKIVASNPVTINAVFATLQLVIGLGIAWRRSLKVALIVSVVWSLVVWWFGESLGGLLTGAASPLGGAPGAVLLYLVLAVLLWPTERSTAGSFVASRPLGATAAKIVWVMLWGGLAALNLQPANLTAGAVHDLVSGNGDGQPGWLKALIDGFASLSAHNGIVILVLIAVGIFLPTGVTRVVVVAAIVVAMFIWLIGEAAGAVFGGQSTDVNSGPLLVLIALSFWPQPATGVAE